MLHLVLTIVTLGLWVFVWLGIAAFGGEKRKFASVDEWGNTNLQNLWTTTRQRGLGGRAKRPLGSGLAAEQPRYDSAKQPGGALAVVECGRTWSRGPPAQFPKRHSTA